MSNNDLYCSKCKSHHHPAVDCVPTHKSVKIRVSDYIGGKTKWGKEQFLEVSFQKLKDRYCCFQGNGKTEGIIGWGNTKKEAIKNLLDNIGIRFI